MLVYKTALMFFLFTDEGIWVDLDRHHYVCSLLLFVGGFRQRWVGLPYRTTGLMTWQRCRMTSRPTCMRENVCNVCTGKVWTAGCRLLHESKLAARQPRRAAHHVIEITTSEGLAQGSYVATRVGFEPATFCTEGTYHHHSTTTLLSETDKSHKCFLGMVLETITTDIHNRTPKNNRSTRLELAYM